MEKHLIYTDIGYAIQTANDPLFDHEKVHFEQSFRGATLHDVTQNEIVNGPTIKRRSSDRSTLNNTYFFTYYYIN